MSVNKQPLHHVVVIVGSRSDLEAVGKADMGTIFKKNKVRATLSSLSAHRTLKELIAYVEKKAAEGTKVFIGAAGMLPALPGAIASIVRNQGVVIGAALTNSEKTILGWDMLAPLASMPPDFPVAVVGNDETGLGKAARLACTIASFTDPEVAEAHTQFVKEEADRKPPEFDIEFPKPEPKPKQ